MALESAKKGMSKWLDEYGDVILDGCKSASECVKRIFEVRDDKYAELDAKYAEPLAELIVRLDKGENQDTELKSRYLEYTGMSEVEFNKDEDYDIFNVPDDWEPEGTWTDFANDICGSSVEEEEQSIRDLLEAMGILDGYELVDGVYRKKN